jgi:hypothetical protein
MLPPVAEVVEVLERLDARIIDHLQKGRLAPVERA